MSRYGLFTSTFLRLNVAMLLIFFYRAKCGLFRCAMQFCATSYPPQLSRRFIGGCPGKISEFREGNGSFCTSGPPQWCRRALRRPAYAPLLTAGYGPMVTYGGDALVAWPISLIHYLHKPSNSVSAHRKRPVRGASNTATVPLSSNTKSRPLATPRFRPKKRILAALMHLSHIDHVNVLLTNVIARPDRCLRTILQSQFSQDGLHMHLHS